MRKDCMRQRNSYIREDHIRSLLRAFVIAAFHTPCCLFYKGNDAEANDDEDSMTATTAKAL